MSRYIGVLVALALVSCRVQAYSNQSSTNLVQTHFSVSDKRPSDCPPCFNCNLEDFKCQQYANCTKSSGRCACPPGYGGEDCGLPLCGSLADGRNRTPRGADDKSCKCKAGWEGINCNVCKTDEACKPMVQDTANAVCYREGLVQKENFQICDITNKQIIKQLDPKIPKATFSCNADREECNFQFWVDEVESFYCALDACSWDFKAEPDYNSTRYACENMKCRCIPGRMLCGEHGSIDLTEFLDQSIRGPASFTSLATEGGSPDDGSKFEEPELDKIISNIFGDTSIFLDCHSGECMTKTEVPGYEKPVKKINTPLISGVIAGCALFVAAVILLVWYLSRRSASNRGPIYLSEDEDDRIAELLADHKPAALHFKDVSYWLNGKQLLSGVQGAVRPGELLAIMGPSGAGKTTFLDILARKNKRGYSQGEFYINGERVLDDEFRSVIGFVDQEDTMLPTLTVHEVILDSALLRLPKEMSLIAKEQKVEDVEKQLGIYHIRNQLIGSEESNGRGISGGEKRRVGIACELVTSPSILFLDEPTSGLDAFNAFNVVECLVNLVKTYNRTVVFTIHQPRSNIVALFDQLILLAKGRLIYSGPFSSCQSYFESIGYSCPSGFNIADYLVDLTMHAGTVHTPIDELPRSSFDDSDISKTRASSTMAVKSIASTMNQSADQSYSGSPSANSAARPKARRQASVKQQQDRQLFTRRTNSGIDTPATNRTDDDMPMPGDTDSQQPWLKMSKTSASAPPQAFDDPHGLPPDVDSSFAGLDSLVSSYDASDVAASIRDDLLSTASGAAVANGSSTGNPYANGTSIAGRVKGYRRIGLRGQFIILSKRTWRNLYRDPMLLLTHYAIAIILAVLIGTLFYGLTDDIPGFQNRLGLVFFVLALFGFSTLTSLSVFAPERLLFVRERAKGYYHPVAYFAAKVFFDIVPLRLIPPIILAIIVYPMTGLLPEWPVFFKFVLFLVLFNFAAAGLCLFLGIVFKNGGVANLIGSLVMLFSLLFSGFLLNHESTPRSLRWLQSLSIFHFGFEGLMVNECKNIRLSDHKYGIDIEVPGSAILSSFGFDVQALWMDVIGLAIFCGAFVTLAYTAMHLLLVWGALALFFHKGASCVTALTRHHCRDSAVCLCDETGARPPSERRPDRTVQPQALMVWGARPFVRSSAHRSEAPGTSSRILYYLGAECLRSLLHFPSSQILCFAMATLFWTTDLEKAAVAGQQIQLRLAGPEAVRSPAAGRPEQEGAVRSLLDGPLQPLPPIGPRRARAAACRYAIFTVYRRLFSFIFVLNIIVLAAVLARHRPITDVLNAAAANLMLCGLARLPQVVNVLFTVFCSLPQAAPLRLRHFAARSAHYGGAHSGAGVASLAWYLAFTILFTRKFLNSSYHSTSSMVALALTYPILLLLLAIVLAAWPALRFRAHNTFEYTHRFAGWLAVALLWPSLLTASHDLAAAEHKTLCAFLVTLPAFWFAIITTTSLFIPWLTLGEVTVVPEPLSSHAIRLHFDYTQPGLGQGIRVATHPWRDWHSFAAFPDSGGPDHQGAGFSLLVSKAGDWTSNCIATQPIRLWKRGIPQHGFGLTTQLFGRFVFVCTGSGIGPALSNLAGQRARECKVLWQTRNPLRTYGPGILKLLKNLDPDPEIVDTDKVGRQNVLLLAWQMVIAYKPEAVFVVSNPKLTREVVLGLEMRGVPAYGALFDS